MDIRVVTVAYNSGTQLADFVESLPGAFSTPYELVMVDNSGFNEDAFALARRHGGQYICPGDNLGYGRAANLGAAGFTGRWLFVVNPDVVFAPGSGDAMISGARLWPKGGAFGPRIETPEGEIYPSARRFPRLGSGIGHALFADVWPNNPWSRAYRENADTRHAHTVDWLSGACLLLRREAFAQIGGFDDAYFMFFEDVALGEALARAGWQSVFLPQAHISHEQGTSWRERPARMIREHHRSAAHYLDEVYRGPLYAPLRVALHTGLRARANILTRGKV